MRRMFCVFAISLALVTAVSQTAQASPLRQTTNTAVVPTMYLSSTPLADGSIYYIVQQGDTLYKISANINVPLDTLERLNNIRRTDILQPGQRLLIGKGTPSTVEPTLAFLPTDTPTPLPVSGKGTICVQIFNDTNGNTTRQTDEVLVGGGQISVALQDGTEVGSYGTDGVNEPHCFNNIPAGEYNVSAAAPKGFNPTSGTTLLLKLQPGDKAYVSFGVQGHVVPTTAPSGGGGGASPLVGVAGLALLVSAGLMLYAVLRPRPKYRLR
jgi:LysM repeat protein